LDILPGHNQQSNRGLAIFAGQQEPQKWRGTKAGSNFAIGTDRTRARSTSGARAQNRRRNERLRRERPAGIFLNK